MKQNIDFAQEQTGKALLKMVMPLFAAMLLMLSYNMVDSIWVGNLLGESGYAALTTAGTVSILPGALATGIGNGTSVLVSQLVGAGDRKRTNEMIVTGMSVTAVFAVALVVFLECTLDRLLLIFRTPANIYADAGAYLSIFLVGAIALFLYMQLTSIYRSFGDPVFQMLGMLAGTLINLVIDPLFIKAYGIAGAAAATTLSQFLCLLFAIFYGWKKGYLHLQGAGVCRKDIASIIKCNMMSSIQSCTPAVSSMIMVILVNRFDVTTIAAYGVVRNIENILFYPAMAMNMALITIIGQLYGAKRMDQMRVYMRTALLYGAVIELVLTALVLLFSRQIAMLFVKETAVADIVSHGLWIISIGYLCYMFTSIFTGKMAGMGKVGMSMGCMLIYYIVIRVPLAVLLVGSSIGLDGIWFAVLVSHLTAVVLAWIADLWITRRERG